jgi:hypothetical protein
MLITTKNYTKMISSVYFRWVGTMEIKTEKRMADRMKEKENYNFNY